MSADPLPSPHAAPGPVLGRPAAAVAPPALIAAALAQLAEGVIVTDAAGRISFVNEAAVRLHGVARLDVAPDAYADTYHLLTEDGHPYPSTELPLARAVLRGETVIDARWRIRRPDGTEVLAVGSARPVVDADGRRAGAVLTLRDDTVRAGVQAALERQSALTRLVADNATSALFLMDREIFDPFVQVDPRLARAREGAGLGLAISRDLARGMGGDLGVESLIGGGSTFTVVLPRALADASPGAAPSATPSTAPAGDGASDSPALGVELAAAVVTCRRLLAGEATGAAHAVLQFLNGRTAHRFTGLYRFDDDVLRNVALHDRADPATRVGADALRRETYCGIVGATEQPFFTVHAGEDPRLIEHAARASVVSYCGALVRSVDGTPVGTLCHFDLRSQPVPADEIPLLEAIAPLLTPFVAPVVALGPGTVEDG